MLLRICGTMSYWLGPPWKLLLLIFKRHPVLEQFIGMFLLLFSWIFFFITAQSFYYFTYFQFVSSNLNTQQIIHIVLKTVRRYCIGYRSTFINFISIPTIICFNLNDGGNACVRYITNVTFMMLTTMSSSIT